MTREKPALMRLLPVLVFAGIAVFFAVALMTGDPSKIPSTLIGKPVPVTAFPAVEELTADGKPVPGFVSADLAKGKATVVNFWASWCAQCVEEHPLLDKLAATSGADLLGVNYKDTGVAARRYLGRYGNPYAAVGTDANGRNAIDWGVYGMPETFVINGKGEIVYKHVGPLSPEAIETKIMPAIAKAKTAVAANAP
ncbi:MAG: DsbE family thiol:disulfide interchange protein [Hyphomicrobium sp.]|nr:DsbE family thiol:disulfide interchange protein [Hyphomicrobium sp.]